MYKTIVAFLSVILFANVASAGFLDFAGDLIDSTSPTSYSNAIYVDSNSNSLIDSGDLLTIIQDFGTVGSTAAGSGSVPASVYGVTFLTFGNQSAVPGSSISSFYDLAPNTAALSSFLSSSEFSSGGSSLTNTLTSGASTSTVLLSSSTDVAQSTLNGGSTDLGLSSGTNSSVSWTVEALFGLGGTNDFFQMRVAGGALSSYPSAYFDSTQNGDFGQTGLLAAGLTLEGYSAATTSTGLATTLGTSDATTYDNLTNSYDIAMQFGAAAYADGPSTATGFNAAVIADFSVDASVPEPSSLAVIAMIGFAGMSVRRRK